VEKSNLSEIAPMTGSSRLSRDISYASAAASPGSRALVRVLENATGRMSLIRRAHGYEDDIARGDDFWEVMCRRFDIRIEVIGGRLDTLPAEGPLVVVANHPYGLLDGLALGRILSGRRGGDFKVLAHSIFQRAPDLQRHLLPIDFSETREAAARNLATRAEALRYLETGGAIGIFPGGTVSTAARAFDQPLDPVWRSFTAKMIARSGATVVPIYFDGQTSRLFQVASHLHYALRLGLLIREFRSRVGTSVRVVVGDPVPRARLDSFGPDARAMMDDLRRLTYALSPRPMPQDVLGHEFEERHARRRLS
jgi:putative hemolysin